IKAIGLEVTNANKNDLAEYNTEYGVKISRGLTPQMQAEELKGVIITEIDNKPVKDVEDVKRIIETKEYYDPISVTFVSPSGEKHTYLWR
ncbi:MAG TPA: S1C family serine protease, partial [Salinimicrobium sp.]|nr:S1C family serine protease [Salinimicrobium sp.]